MIDKKYKLEGWESKRRGYQNYLQCPYCGEIDNISSDKCLLCKRNVTKKEAKQITLKEIYAVCKVCGIEHPLKEIFNGFGYECYNCKNYIAIKFKNDIIQPKTVMKLNWNKDIIDRAIKINDNISIIICENEKDFLALKFMQRMAYIEGHSFLLINDKQNGGLVLDTHKNTYIGYFVWTENKNAIIRQIFIIKDKRNKGYGTTLVKFWVENIADKLSKEFGVDSPKEFTNEILVKLGYANFEDEKRQIRGIKCFFASSSGMKNYSLRNVKRIR